MSKRSRRRKQHQKERAKHASDKEGNAPPATWAERDRTYKLPMMGTSTGNHSFHEKPGTRTRKGTFAKQLLHAAEEKEPVSVVVDGIRIAEVGEDLLVEIDNRSLIDKVHEATFRDDPGMQWIRDKYALRNALRKAHRFTLGVETSALIADFSIAISQDLDAARRLALPPFPVTWFDVDNVARINRIKSLGSKLTSNAENNPTARVGWLITPHSNFDYCATYFTDPEMPVTGMMTSPLAFCWNIGEPFVGEHKYATEDSQKLSSGLAFGIADTGVHIKDASIYPGPFHGDIAAVLAKPMTEQEGELQREIAGELRHIFGLLIALGAGHLGATQETADQPKYAGPKVYAKGKELLPLEHKTLTIKLAKRTTAKVVAAKAIYQARKRWHEVRAHWREFKNPDGSVRLRVPVKSHERGDKHLGVIEKTYRVEK